MEDKDLQKVIVALQDTIEKTVNGKIKRLDEKLDAYIKLDTDWKLTVQPVIDAYDTANRAGDFIQWISKIILAIGVIIGGIIYTQK